MHDTVHVHCQIPKPRQFCMISCSYGIVLTVKVIHLKPIRIRSPIIDRLEFFLSIRAFDRGGLVFDDPLDYVKAYE